MDFLRLVGLAILAVMIQGYHPGLEDDTFYLAAIRKDLNPALFLYDGDFFTLQFQATIFDKLIAWSVRLTHLPLEWDVFIWHFAAIFMILWCCREISRRCFSEAHAQWAAVALVAALLTIPVSGTGLSLVDQYLHPRALATVAILGAIAATLERRTRVSAVLLAIAAAIHLIMAGFGISFCIFLAWKRPARRIAVLSAFVLPLGWVFDPASSAWHQAAATRTFYFILQWEWYEWLGVGGPLVLLWWFASIARRNGWSVMAQLASRLTWFALFQLVVGLIIMLPPGLERLRPVEPMRFLHLTYLLLFMLGGGLIGQYLLRRHVLRWLVFFVPLGLGMCYAQRQIFPATEHLELPGTAPRNDWVKAFNWIRENTPPQSLFALDPMYMELPGEDFHGFRALAARSVLADNLKDPGMAARVPRLAPRWRTEVEAQSNWKNFQAADFKRLKTEFGVDWVLLAGPGGFVSDVGQWQLAGTPSTRTTYNFTMSGGQWGLVSTPSTGGPIT